MWGLKSEDVIMGIVCIIVAVGGSAAIVVWTLLR